MTNKVALLKFQQSQEPLIGQVNYWDKQKCKTSSTQNMLYIEKCQ